MATVKVKVKRNGFYKKDGKKAVQCKLGEVLEVTERTYDLHKDKLSRVGGSKEEKKSKEKEFDVEKASVDELLVKAEELKIDVKDLDDEKALRKAVAKALK